MSYRIQFFAGLAESVGRRELEFTDIQPATVAGLRGHLKTLFPQLSADIDGALVAVNQKYASPMTPLSVTDEIALIPPVGGGSPSSESSCRITEQPLCIEDANSFLVNAHCGGTVLFCGTVREWTNGVQTEYLSYEAYVEMAILQMKQIEADVHSAWPGVTTLQWHRIGRLDAQEVAVICGAAAPHRDAAFQAARTLIERLKKEVPIWKKEVYVDGAEVWQANPQTDPQ